jgi:hypothetical protein
MNSEESQQKTENPCATLDHKRNAPKMNAIHSFSCCSELGT